MKKNWYKRPLIWLVVGLVAIWVFCLRQQVGWGVPVILSFVWIGLWVLLALDWHKQITDEHRRHLNRQGTYDH